MAGVGELKSESNIQQLIRLALAEAGHVVFRNNIGGYKSPSGRWVDYGVGGKGGSDLLGWTKDGKFLAVEVKTATGRIRPEQETFIAAVKRAGGRAGIARGVDDALRIANGG